MKNILCFWVAILLTSCEYTLIKNKNPEYSLSTNELFFDAKGGRAVVKVTSNHGDFTLNEHFQIDGKGYPDPDAAVEEVTNNEVCRIIRQGDIEWKTVDVCDATGYIIKTTSSITGSWFSIEADGIEQIVFTIFPNNTGKQRSLLCKVGADKDDGVTVTQSAE